MARLNKPKESATRTATDTILTNLGWCVDETSADCNVFTERCKTAAQNKALKGNEPDYVLYRSRSDEPIAVIEAKRGGQSMAQALRDAIRKYATPLNVDIVFVTDRAIVQSHDRRTGRPLEIDDEPVTGFLSEAQLLRFVDEGPNVRTPAKVTHSKKELIAVFADANDLLRKEGLREGVERFTEFSNLLFLKLISEIEADREQRGERRILEKRYCWEKFSGYEAQEMLDYINDTILPKLVGRYNHSGDVFQSKLLITNAETLKRIVDKLSALSLLDTDSDIKGDAFEYFLKNSITVGNDLGEYFTPRHIVKLMVDLTDPVYQETVYDPCCGTGGFLIAAFEHIKRKVKPTPKVLDVLTRSTIYGRELTGTAKIAKMNMIIAGDGHTNIIQTDSLKSPVRGEYDVVLTNYPFSQRTDFSEFYGLETEDANPVFLKHVIDALQPKGRAAVVVPDGLLFDTKAQYVKARRLLLERCRVVAVIKLHRYVFRPYTGQPTSILIFEKGKPTDKVWFFDVREDGFKKTASKKGRAPIPENDLLTLRALWPDKPDSDQSWTVDIEAIRANRYSLSMNAYAPQPQTPKDWVPLGGPNGVCDVRLGATPPTGNPRLWGGPHPWVTISDMTEMYVKQTQRTLTDEAVKQWSGRLLPKGTVLLSFKLSVGRVAIAGKPLYTNEAIVGLIPKDARVLPKYLYWLLPFVDYSAYEQPAAKGMTLNKGIIESIRIPLPSLAEQRKFIDSMDRKDAELRSLQKRVAVVTGSVGALAQRRLFREQLPVARPATRASQPSSKPAKRGRSTSQ